LIFGLTIRAWTVQYRSGSLFSKILARVGNLFCHYFVSKVQTLIGKSESKVRTPNYLWTSNSDKAMKQKQLSKYTIAGILAFSLFSMLYVNMDAARSSAAFSSTAQTSTTVIQSEEDKQERNIPIPDVTVLSRMLELAQRLVSNTP